MTPMTSMQTNIRFALAALLLILSQPALAVLNITITQGMKEALPIAVVPFGWNGAPGTEPIDMNVTIANDLARSGRFKPMEPKDMPQRPVNFQDINFHDWQLLGMENLVVGNLKARPDGGFDVEFRLVDVYHGTQIAGFRIPAARSQLRRTAHRISDIIFEKLTGIRGAFDTRIAYITVEQTAKGKKMFALQIADADGFDPKVLVKSPQPLMSPAWSPDGSHLAYVSFEDNRSVVYVQDVVTGQRERIAAHPGINSAPAFSPDGTQLALTLSKDGNPEIYILDLSSRSLRRITHDRAIDTEPTWSPDGTQIAFTSDRGGTPQIYEISVNGGSAKRLTFNGSYNARPRFSPDGKSIAMVHGQGGAYHIAVLNLKSGRLDVITNGRLDESPSFAPNGSMIIYSTIEPTGSVLAAVSVDGRVHQRLALQTGEVEEPAWGPFPPSQ